MPARISRTNLVFSVICGIAACASLPTTAHAQFAGIGAGLTGITDSAAAWGDYDNDGDLDILITGRDAGFSPVSQVWQSQCTLPQLVAFHASDGQFSGFVRMSWRAVDGAVGYREFRSEDQNPSNPVDVSGLTTNLSFDDATANVPLGMAAAGPSPKRSTTTSSPSANAARAAPQHAG